MPCDLQPVVFVAVSSAVFLVVATFLPAPDVVAMLFVLAVALSQAVSSAVFLVVATFLSAPDAVAMLFVLAVALL